MRYGIVSGSFDPITLGHLYVVKQALDLEERVIILIADNPTKKYMFDRDERKQLVLESVAEVIKRDRERVRVEFLPANTFTAKYAENWGAAIYRGLRNVVDFEYEHSQQLINSAIAPEVKTLFVMPPTDLIAVSSSAIKGMAVLDGWDSVASKYVPQCVIKALEEKS